MTIIQGIPQEYVKDRAQTLINNQVIGNYTLNLTNYFSNYYFPLLSEQLFNTLGNDELIRWHQSRLPDLTNLVNFTLLATPALVGNLFNFDFSGQMPTPQNCQVSITNQGLRGLLNNKEESTCVFLSNNFFQESFSNTLAYYSSLFYFNRTLNTQFPDVKSISPFYSYEVTELMMWGAGMWDFIKQKLNIQNQTQTFEILSSEIQIDCRDFSPSKLSIKQITGKTVSDSIHMGPANLQGMCTLQVARDYQWVQLFDIEYEFSFDVLLKFESRERGEYLNRIVGSISNLKLVSFSTPNQGIKIYLNQLRLRINTIIQSLPTQVVELLGEGLNTLQYYKENISLEINDYGLSICGTGHFPLN